MKILVGSKAAKVYIPSFRDSKDIDYFSSHAIQGTDYGVYPNDVLEAFEEESKVSGVATLNDLLTIKLSHLPYDIFWHKHLNDYLVFKKYGGIINEKLYWRLKEHWKEYHGNKPYLSLYRTKDSFFDDFVKKEVDHDYLHELIAYPNRPVYEACLKENQEVAIDKDKFYELVFDQQVKMFREEMNVIACERWLIPTKESGSITFLQAWNKSVHKTVTALTKGWASEFICENIESFLKPNRKEVSHAFAVLNIKV